MQAPQPDSLHVSDYLELMRSLPDSSVDMILTDPPYNTTNLHYEFELPLDIWWQECKRILKPSGCVVMTGSQPFTSKVIASNYAWFRWEWIWVKNRATGFLDANRKPLKTHENVMVFSPKRAMYNPQMGEGEAYVKRPTGNINHYTNVSRIDGINAGTRYPNTILEFDIPSGNKGAYPLHNNEKPVELFAYLIATHSSEGDLILDPFCGSGTTAVAAKHEQRHYICGDISAEYIDIARKRVNPTFGEPPKRVKDGLPLSDLPLFAQKAAREDFLDEA